MENMIWDYGRGFFKVFLENRDYRDRIASWDGCIVHGYYWYPDGTRAWDIICPTRLYNRVAGLVGLPKKKKSPKRVAQGKKLGEMAVADDHLKLKASGDVNSIAPVND